MIKIEKYILTDSDIAILKEAQRTALACPDIKNHDCSVCPLYIDVNRDFVAGETFRCLSSLVDSLIWRNEK